MIEISKNGYTAYALAYIPFEETGDEYIKLEVSDKIPCLTNSFVIMEIKDNFLLAILDKNQFPSKKYIERVFFNNKIKTFMDDVYIHPSYKK